MSPVLSRLMAAAAGVLRNCRPRYTRDDESYLDELASALTEMEREVAGPVDVDEPVGTTTDELVGLREAFAAGADWMRERVINRLPGGWDAEEAADAYTLTLEAGR